MPPDNLTRLSQLLAYMIDSSEDIFEVRWVCQGKIVCIPQEACYCHSILCFAYLLHFYQFHVLPWFHDTGVSTGAS